MFVLFDCLPFQTINSRTRGIGRYCVNLLAGLREVRPDWDIQLLVHSYLPEPDADLLEGRTVHRFTPPLKHIEANREANEHYLGDWIAARHPDWVLHPSVFEVDGLIAKYTSPKPAVATVMYDLIPLAFCNTYGVVERAASWYPRRLRDTLRADLLLAISESTAVDTRRLYVEDTPQVVNIRGAADPSFRAAPKSEFIPAEAAVRARFGLTKPFLLYVGGCDIRKNMTGAIAGYGALPAEIREQYDLVLACHVDAEHQAHFARAAAKHGVTHQVKVTGFVSDADLRTLYQACRLFFFPSLYEGLGLPVVEAMRYGAPVVTSDCSSLPEYAGEVSWYCDPECPESMAKAIRTALEEPYELRLAERTRFSQQFTWADTAERAARAIEAAEPVIPAVPAKKRIAWVCPAPPTETGIADYALEVAETLRDRFELEWVIDPHGPIPDMALTRQYRMIRGDEVDARHAAKPYDLFLYHMGNNYFHTYMLPIMQRHPGLTVVHDLHLGGLFRMSQEQGVWPTTPHEELLHNGEWLFAEWVKSKFMDPLMSSILSGTARRIIDLSFGIVVHSRDSWQKVRKMTDAPVAIVPHIATPPKVGTQAEERKRLGLPADKFLVATLGHVGPSKRIDSVIEAAAALPEDVRRKTHVLIVGPIHPEIAERFRTSAAKLGIPGQVEVRGRVPLSDFAAYVTASDVCVQLRYPSNGETSGALTRAMAAGVACVTSDMPTMAEIPNTVSIKVRSPICDATDLTAALTKLARDPAYRAELGENARRYMAETHGPAVIAAKYSAAIDDTIERLAAQDMIWQDRVMNALADATGPIPDALYGTWARLRDLARRPSPIPSELPDLPEVPAERQPQRQVA